MSGALRIAHLHWSQASRSPTRHGRHLLHDISLDVAAGTFVGLIGPNGSGKTSLLRCAFRYARPLAGTIWIDDIDVWKASPRSVAQRIAVLLQESPDDFGLTVDDVVSMGRTPFKRLFDGDNDADRHHIAQALQQVDLWRDRERSFASLSGGEKQRALLARALVQQPTLLILDEPTNHLDPHHQTALLRLIKQQGITTLATLHDLNLAAAFCDRLYVIDQGMIVAQGTPHAVLTTALMRDVFNVATLIDEHPISGVPRITYLHTP